MDKNKVTIGKILKIIFFAVAIPLLIMSICIMYKANRYPDKIPGILGYKPMIVLSGSMETSIYTGDLVFVKEVDPNVLKSNDIIAFRNETNTVTTHRIIEVVTENGEKKFRTKGDNNDSEDNNLVETSQVEGIYAFKISKLGNFLMFLQQPMGLIMILLIILVVGLIWLHFANKKDDAKYRKEFEEFKKQQQSKH